MYGEVLIALNTVFNYLMLSFTNAICIMHQKKRRLLLAAFLGGVVVVICEQRIWAMLLSFLCMTVTAFGWQIKKWAHGALVCIVAALFAGGLLTTLEPLFYHMPTVYFALTSSVVAVAGLIVLKNRWTHSKQHSLQQQLLLSTRLHFADGEIPLKCFIDTGNTAIEPLSGRPLQFIRYKTVSEQLPAELNRALLQWNAEEPYTLSMFHDDDLRKICVIRFATVQGKPVYGIGLRYDKWEIIGEDITLLPKGYFMLTEQVTHFPQEADAILHFSTLCQ